MDTDSDNYSSDSVWGETDSERINRRTKERPIARAHRRAARQLCTRFANPTSTEIATATLIAHWSTTFLARIHRAEARRDFPRNRYRSECRRCILLNRNRTRRLCNCPRRARRGLECSCLNRYHHWDHYLRRHQRARYIQRDPNP